MAGKGYGELRLAFFDLDGTLIDGFEYIYQHLWEYYDVEKSQTREVLRKYLNGDVSYEDWVKNDVRLLQEAGATKQSMLKAIGKLYPMQGAVDTIKRLKENSYKVFVISGGIDLVIDAVFGDEANTLFDGVFINRYIFDENGKLLRAIPTPYDMEHKATCIIDTASKYNADLDHCYFIGDNENDIDAVFVAGVSIAFNCKSDKLAQVATYHIESNNLYDVLDYLITV